MKLDAKLMVVLTAVIAVATAVNVWVFWYESEDTSRKIQTMSDKAGEIVGSMNTAISNNQDAISKAFAANKLALASSEQQSKEALDASIAASRRDQRPWLILSGFELSADPVPGVPITATFWIINSGKTPAIRAAPAVQIMTWPLVEPPLTDFSGIPVDTQNAGVIPPGPAPAGLGINWHFTSTALTLTPAQVAGYRNGTTLIYGHALVHYRDTFTNDVQHWTLICVAHKYGRPLNEVDYCRRGNDVDHAQ